MKYVNHLKQLSEVISSKIHLDVGLHCALVHNLLLLSHRLTLVSED